MHIWVDPACPFCWTTARWLVESVSRLRNLSITWHPISLFVKNEPTEGSAYHAPTLATHRMLRVLLAAEDRYDNTTFGKLYWEFASRIHHDGSPEVVAVELDIADALHVVGLDPALAEAADDATYDERITASMDDGFSLTGHDVGTPIVAIERTDGTRAGYYGPVITRIPPDAQSAQMWDALVALMYADSFFELKRNRTEAPNPGGRPTPI